MNTSTKVFNASNPNFWARLLIFALSVLTLIGIKFPDSPAVIADQVTTVISTSGFYAVLGILVVSLIMPIYNFVKTKPNVTLSAVIGSPNFWIYALSFVFGLAVLYGIKIPDGTAEQVIGAIYQKDWIGLLNIAFINIIDPIIRFFRDKKNAQTTA
jgi:uncharacterized membrane protein